MSQQRLYPVVLSTENDEDLLPLLKESWIDFNDEIVWQTIAKKGFYCCLSKVDVKFPENICEYACKGKSVITLSLLNRRGYKLTVGCLAYATAFSYIPTMKWLFKNDCPIDEVVFEEAIRCNSTIQTLKLLHKKKCPYPENCITLSAREGNAECLNFLLQNGYPLYVSAFYEAISRDNLVCLKLLVEFIKENENHKDFFEDVRIYKKARSVQALKYLHEQGFKWNIQSFPKVVHESGNGKYCKPEMVRYAFEQGCPFDFGNILELQYGIGAKCKYEKEYKEICEEMESRSLLKRYKVEEKE